MVQKLTNSRSMAYGSQTLHRAYSVSSVEGIELRLNDKFKPTQKVTLPLQYKHMEPQSTNHSDEYDFKTENNFLQWLQSVRRAEAEREEQRKQQQLGAEAAAAALEREDTVPDGDAPTSSDFLMQRDPVQRPHLTPVAASLGQEILQPVPLSNSISKPASNSTSTRTDNWDDFEGRALDPFELAELETINDMEELRSVLANSAPPAPVAVANNQLQQSSPPPGDLPREESTLTPDSGNMALTENSHQITMETTLDQVSFKSCKSYQTNAPSRTPDIPPRYESIQQPTALQADRTVSNTSPCAMSSPKSEPFSSKTPLPPIGPLRESSSTSLPMGDSTGSGSGTSEHSSALPPPYTAIDTSPSPSTSGYSLPLEPPPNYPLDELDANFYPVNLNRFSPLPPAAPPLHTISLQERDPTYEAMSVEEKNFVNTIVGMGFPKGRTARAVKNIGSDDRQVIDLLCAVDTLCGLGFPEEKVELALSLQDNNQEKAQAFLSLWQRFEELGFKSEDIKRELILHGNNEEKVLDTLTR